MVLDMPLDVRGAMALGITLGVALDMAWRFFCAQQTGRPSSAGGQIHTQKGGAQPVTA